MRDQPFFGQPSVFTMMSRLGISRDGRKLTAGERSQLEGLKRSNGLSGLIECDRGTLRHGFQHMCSRQRAPPECRTPTSSEPPNWRFPFVIRFHGPDCDADSELRQGVCLPLSVNSPDRPVKSSYQF
jgi:hypothetical protein